MTGAPERELKFEFDAGEPVETALAAFLADAGQGRRVQHFESVYFDTPRLDLRARGLVLRVRRAGDRYLQTIKRIKSPGASFDRWEVEHEIAGPAPHFDPEDRAALGAIALKAGKAAFRPVFTVKSERTTWNSEAGGAAVEVALDRGHIVAGGHTSTLCELEIELKQGSAKDLFALGRRLAALAALRPTTFTKDERGYRLLDESWGRAVHARSAPITQAMNPREAFRAVGLECVQHFLLNEMVVRAGFDSEAIHQARIAVRRLRSALSLFRPIAADDRYEAVKSDLKFLSDALGEARDADVFQARILAPAVAQAGAAAHGLDALAAMGERVKLDRYQELIATLASEHCRQKLIGLIEWLEAGDWAGNEDRSDETARAFVRRRIRKAYKRLLRDSAEINDLADEQVHDIRKRAKRLRYCAEFISGVMTGKSRERHKRFLTVLGRVQTRLGKRQDKVFAREMLADLANAPDASMARTFAAGHLDGRLCETLARSRRRGIAKALDALSDSPPA
jgi:inorganic triphosphatase YgiF